MGKILNKDNGERGAALYRIVRNVVIISGIFIIIVSVIILANFIQLKIHDPINSPELLEMIEKVHREGETESLKDLIREYDLLVRKAHFTALAFHRFGVYLLLGGSFLFFMALLVMKKITREMPKPEKFREFEDKPERIFWMERGVFLFFALLMAFALVLPRIFENPLHAYRTESFSKVEVHAVRKIPSFEEQKANWPNFRGFRGLGFAEKRNPPISWNTELGENIFWKVEVPKQGYSSPVVWEDKVFLTGADKESREVYCWDLKSGAQLWKIKSDLQVKIPEVTEDTGLAAPTMAVDGRFTAAVFATGELLVSDFSGVKLWYKKLDTPVNYYGHSSSLLIWKDSLFVQYDFDGGAKLFSFDLATGNLRWEKHREVETSWTSPVLIEGNNGEQLILIAYPRIIAYDPETGGILWKIENVIEGEIGPSAAFDNGKLFVVNQYSILACIDMQDLKIRWQYEDNLPDAASPAASNDFLILPSSHGTVSCFDCLSGDLYWEHKFPKGSYASPLIVDDKVFWIDKEGTMHIFKLDKTFQSISDVRIGEPCYSTPAFVQNKILIRGEKHLYCLGTSHG